MDLILTEDQKIDAGPEEKRIATRAVLADGERFSVVDLEDGQVMVTLIKDDGAGPYVVQHTGDPASVKERCAVDARRDVVIAAAIAKAIPERDAVSVPVAIDPAIDAIKAALPKGPRR